MKPHETTLLSRDQQGLFSAFIGDGRPLLLFTGLSIVLSGGFALFLAATGHFLPHDTQFLGMTAEELCTLHECRIVRFMIHDRVAFGGALISIGLLYMWLAEFPLRRREAWAWWLFALSGLLGFGSFLAYLGYGYLDIWHGLATLILLPCFGLGLFRSAALLPRPLRLQSLFQPALPLGWKSPLALGRLCLLLTALGMSGGGLTILFIGMTQVFVPQDLHFMGLLPADLQAINPRLAPLIAHDRAGFGGGVLTTGITIFFSVWCAAPSRSLWQTLCLAGCIGFATAIGIHPLVGYNDLIHLAPALLGAVMFAVGIGLCYKPMVRKPQYPGQTSK
ncbi:MAG: hypothetical protein DPW09_30115 [Anaerolineae bacterium]|nr:hypothetical protein [Anaerolineales bacterium]MCQ3977705.1 hypothetical protein [Anaerolineae bacterium]